MPFILAMLALHYSVAEEKRYYTHAAVLFSVMYGTLVSFDYVVQLTTVIPATLADNWARISLLDQTPYSLFWDVDALEYIFLPGYLARLSDIFQKGKGKMGAPVLSCQRSHDPVISWVYLYSTYSSAHARRAVDVYRYRLHVVSRGFSVGNGLGRGPELRSQDVSAILLTTLPGY